METFDLMLEIENYISQKGLSYSDSILDLINALAKDFKEEQ